MRHTLALFCLPLVFSAAACGASQQAPPATAEIALGSANGPPGGVLVMSAHCAGMERRCPSSWAPAVDAIVTSGLAFHGYRTIDPAGLRKDAGTRTEKTVDTDTKTETSHHDEENSVGAVAIIPIASFTTSQGRTVRLTQSHEKTVVLEGATFDDLTPQDRQALMKLAGAHSVLTTQVIVGANWSVWTMAQSVQVVIKLSDAESGAMRWSSRCSASSDKYPSVDAAIEAAAHCTVDAVTTPPVG